MSAWSGAAVGFGGLTVPRQLLGPMPVELVFTRAERLRSGAGRTLRHWAGRLAAKYAVLRLLEVPVAAEALGAVEVLPAPTPMCARNVACLHGHPPRVRLGGHVAVRASADTRVRVSISHTADLALAVALASSLLPEDHALDHDLDHDLDAVSGWT